jgi:dTDP-4-dehydrorhamnose reductase
MKTPKRIAERDLKIAVTGASGQLGRSLIETTSGAPFTLVPLQRPAFDLLDAACVERSIAAAAPDLLVNAAAYSAVDAAEADAAAAFAANADGAERVARACARLGIPIVHLSTDYVFGGTGTSAYVETDRTGPQSVYGRSKLEGEQRVAAACSRHIILRTAWVHSPFGANFVKTMLRLAADREEIAVVEDQVGNPTYAPHLAATILAIARRFDGHADVPWGIFHAAGSGSASWADVAREVFAVSGGLGGPTATVVGIPAAAYPGAAKRPANSRLDCSKLRDIFGLGMPDWQSGVREGVGRLLSHLPT